MTNDNKEEVSNSNEVVTITVDMAKEYSSNPILLSEARKQLKRLSRTGAKNLIKMVLWGYTKIKAKGLVSGYKSFVRHNLGIFEKDENSDDVLRLNFIKLLRHTFNGILAEIGKEIVQYEKKGKEGIKLIKGGELPCYILEERLMYDRVRKLICDEGGELDFTFDFINSKMLVTFLGNKHTLQRCFIQILSKPIKFDYPVEYNYSCGRCGTIAERKIYEVASNNYRHFCQGYISYQRSDGQVSTKLCGAGLVPDYENSLSKDGYYYHICYEDEFGEKKSGGAISFKEHQPGYYEAVLYKIRTSKKFEMYAVMDVNETKVHIIKFPKKDSKINYIFTLQKVFDKFILERTGMEIFGLNPVKVGMIIQKAFKEFGFRLVSNVQLVGDPSVGKSIVLKYYSFLLNGANNVSSNGLSISIPGLRGTRTKIDLMEKEITVQTPGYLGTFKTIHIDEAGENKELVQNLKTFLVDDNYSYDKAGGTGFVNKRTAHVNLSENLDYTHLGQYRGSIRKSYRESNVKIGEEEKIAWDESWDLHLPLFKYTNPYLRKIIKEKRTEHRLKQMFWIDGYDYALHERFPFYFYIVSEKESLKFKEIVRNNVQRKPLSENMDLIRALKTDSIDILFKSFTKYIKSENDSKAFEKVDKILKDYDVHADARLCEFYYQVLQISRIINQRTTYEEIDFELLKWILEKTNCKIDVVDTDDYKVIGPPDLQKQKEIDTQIEEETKEVDDAFGLPEGEFE